MKAIFVFAFLLLASSSALANPSQPEQVVAGEYQHSHPAFGPTHQHQYLHPQPYPQSHPEHLAIEQHQPLTQEQHNALVAGQQPAVSLQAQPVGQVDAIVAPQPPQQPQQAQPVSGDHHTALQAAQQAQAQQPNYYSPAGLIQVVGDSAPVSAGPKPVPQVSVQRAQYSSSNEQYGQPESAALPPNYKPFGSWGLYIGGNPADGYYTNYYKALSSSVDKQQGGEQNSVPVVPKPVSSVSSSAAPSGVVGQTSAFSPLLRQAIGAPVVSSPYVGSDFYSFAYSPSELNSPTGAQQQVPQPQQGQPGPVYGVPASYEPSPYGSVSHYADAYATKKVGSAYVQQKEVAAPKELVQQPAKGHYQSRVYVYPSPAVGQLAAPAVLAAAQAPVVHQQHQHSHVVAYPVPVGSQIVGSQAGIDGSFSPYGVHAFTRYAVKPTVVNQDQAYYYSYPTTQQVSYQPAPVYKQQQAYSVQQANSAPYYPMSFYGYPLNQLHYSQATQSAVQEPHHGPVGQVVESAVQEKAEAEVKQHQQQQQQQRRA